MNHQYTIIPLEEKYHQQWDDFVTQHPRSSIYHLRIWQDIVIKTFNHKCHYFMAIDNSKRICGILPLVYLSSLIFGKHLISLPYFNYGSTLAENEEASLLLIDKAIDVAKNNKIGHIQLRHISMKNINAFNINTDKANMVLKLPQTTTQLKSLLKSKVRNQIKRAEREDVNVACGGLELIDDFYTVFCQKMRDLGTPVYSKSFFENIIHCFPVDCKIIVVYWGGKPVSTGFLLQHKQSIEVPWASTLKHANSISVNMFLYWQLISFAISRGCTSFDFGRSTVNSGSYRFKKQWGAQPKLCYWYNWISGKKVISDLSPANPTFYLAIKVWQKLPLFLTNLIGPLVVKNLP